MVLSRASHHPRRDCHLINTCHKLVLNQIIQSPSQHDDDEKCEKCNWSAVSISTCIRVVYNPAEEMGHNRVRGRKPHEIYSIICFVGQNFFRLPIALSIHRILMILLPREVIHQRRRRDDTSGRESEKEQLIKSLAQTRNNESTLSNKLLRRHLGTDHIVQIPRDGK